MNSGSKGCVGYIQLLRYLKYGGYDPDVRLEVDPECFVSIKAESIQYSDSITCNDVIVIIASGIIAGSDPAPG